MFARETYLKRRNDLIARLGSGIVLLPGNGESPMNYADNCYRFRQDSTFLYYIGLNQPELAAIINVDGGTTTVFADELTIDMIVWTGPLPTVAERAERAGIVDIRPYGELAEAVQAARTADRAIHYLPPYRADTTLQLSGLLGVSTADVGGNASVDLVRAVVNQRIHKSDEEVVELEKAVAISVEMHKAAMRMVGPGVTERAIAAEVERVAVASGGRLSFPIIATINGQTLHNHIQPNTLSDGDVFLLDSGAQTALGYAGDLTSTMPVSAAGFDEKQKTIHAILMNSYAAAVGALAPGVPFRDVHFESARVIFDGLKDLGLMKGDTEEAVAAGAHALVYPHGLGHMMGLDVHDMENLGEHYVGYDEKPRSDLFGLKSLRLARPLEPGFVFTVEPGIYFIPELIDDWKARGHCGPFINFDAFGGWRDFGGMRNEEDYLVTAEGARRLGPHKPQTLEEVEAVRAG